MVEVIVIGGNVSSALCIEAVLYEKEAVISPRCFVVDINGWVVFSGTVYECAVFARERDFFIFLEMLDPIKGNTNIFNDPDKRVLFLNGYKDRKIQIENKNITENGNVIRRQKVAQNDLEKFRNFMFNQSLFNQVSGKGTEMASWLVFSR